MTPEQKALGDATAARETTVKAVKTYYDKMNRELAEVSIVEEKLKNRGWGDGPVTYMRDETEKQKEVSVHLFKKWTEAKADRHMSDRYALRTE